MLTEEKVEEIKKQLEGLSPEDQQKKLATILASLSPEEREELVGKPQCPFCLITEGKITAKKVYEDEHLLAVLDIRPANKGHILLFPKHHDTFLSQVPDYLVRDMFSLANKISVAVFEAVKAEGTNIIIANGAAAGQTSPHVLVHIIPRFSKDTVLVRWDGQETDSKELEQLQGEIQKRLPKEEPKKPQSIDHTSEEKETFALP